MDMVTGKFYIHNIDYHTLIKMVMPYMAKGLSDRKSIFSDIVKGLISRQGKPRKITDLLVSIIPDKDHTAAAILPHFNEELIQILNDLLSKNRIVAVIKAIDFKSVERTSGKMLKIEITLGDIDYEKSANLAPKLFDQLTKLKGSAGKAARFMLSQGELTGNGELPVNIIMAAIGAIPVSQRDELAAGILSEYRKEIKKALNELIVRNNIQAEIRDIKIQNN
jgi:hypothetical protein